ncbi:hypothetical protein [Crenobacter luteus]|uniref:Uncharacterized protein n=1 Tax=Crenobacter luteus TaxID=1452487 RepID=A0A163C2U3_9NEIS|nr:hypothetical protein [Crenobacter luteus]KZE29706.1 hypothetical protein AVW16_13340 [Crenobacter luteus]
MNAIRQACPPTPCETVAGYFLTVAREPSALSDAGAEGVLEALLPIRPFAMLLAARRADWNERSPARFADAADWLAATIVALQLAEVDVALDELPLLDVANDRLAALAGELGVAVAPAQPRLVREFAGAAVTRRGRSRLAQPVDANLSAVARSCTLAACCRAALPAPLARAAGLA